MLKIGITEDVYTNVYGYKNGLERMRAHGFESMDYQGFLHTEDPLFQKNSREFECFLREQRKIAYESGIGIHQVHGPWRWPPQDATEEERNERFEKMIHAIEGTAILGSENFIIHPIMPYQADDRGHEQDSYEMNFKFMEKLSDAAEEYGVRICFENMPMPNLSLGSVEAVLAFVKNMNRKCFEVCLDTGHCTMFGRTPHDAVKIIGKEHLCALHIHDNDGKTDAHWSPFAGIIDWEKFGKALFEIHYNGVISLEAKPPMQSKEMYEQELIKLSKAAKYIAGLAAGDEGNEKHFL